MHCIESDQLKFVNNFHLQLLKISVKKIYSRETSQWKIMYSRGSFNGFRIVVSSWFYIFTDVTEFKYNHLGRFPINHYHLVFLLSSDNSPERFDTITELSGVFDWLVTFPLCRRKNIFLLTRGLCGDPSPVIIRARCSLLIANPCRQLRAGGGSEHLLTLDNGATLRWADPRSQIRVQYAPAPSILPTKVLAFGINIKRPKWTP